MRVLVIKRENCAEDTVGVASEVAQQLAGSCDPDPRGVIVAGSDDVPVIRRENRAVNSADFVNVGIRQRAPE